MIPVFGECRSQFLWNTCQNDLHQHVLLYFVIRTVWFPSPRSVCRNRILRSDFFQSKAFVGQQWRGVLAGVFDFG